jgi:hypothetical protein
VPINCRWVFFRMVAHGRGGPLRPLPIKSFDKAFKTACRKAGVSGRIQPRRLRFVDALNALAVAAEFLDQTGNLNRTREHLSLSRLADGSALNPSRYSGPIGTSLRQHSRSRQSSMSSFAYASGVVANESEGRIR